LTVSNWGSEPPVSGHLVEEWFREKDGMVMVYVPPPNTPFTQRSGLAAPTQGFWIDKYEVTNGQYQLCVKAGVCPPSLYANDNRFNGANHPVAGVSWHDAAAYARWVGGALPTEEEWEYAAAGEARRVYPWGDQFDGKRLNFCDVNCTENWKDSAWNDGYIFTAPVGSYPTGESWVGAADMTGNVWEWTDSWYDEAQTWRVGRGGSFNLNSDFARAAFRYINTPDYRASDYGFRVVVRRPPSP
jgi:formylglycine-generating enzyme required for sulfatase activity